jgi:response regulator RpfG family c-di-GMP phosphodiesterase
MVQPLIRPCFLVVDQEHSGSISTRKLVIETAKFNVITAYSGAEAIQTLKRFPAMDGVVIDAGITDLPCSEVVKQLKAIQRNVIIVVVGTLGNDPCAGADHYLETFDPARLLRLLQRLQPEKTAMILEMDERLSDSNE